MLDLVEPWLLFLDTDSLPWIQDDNLVWGSTGVITEFVQFLSGEIQLFAKYPLDFLSVEICLSLLISLWLLLIGLYSDIMSMRLDA